MIVCTNCGNHNEDSDEFCGSCGKFLEWVGQKVEDPKPVEVAAPEPEPEEVKVGLMDRVKAAVGMEGGGGTSAMDVDEPTAAAATTSPTAPPEQAPDNRAEELARLEAEEQARRDEEARARLAAEEEARLAQEREEAERARAQAEAEAAAAEAARRAKEAEEAEAARRQAQAEAEEAARREREAAGAQAAAAAAEESARLRAEAEAAERARAQADAEAAAAEEDRKRKEAEAAEAARKQAEAEEQRRLAEEQRAKREAEARADAARRAAALLSQPRHAEPVADAKPDAATSTSTPAHATAPTATPSTAPAAAAASARPAVAPAQEPARPKAPPRPATQVQVDQGPKPGDLICTECGTGNDPTRKFCRRCGNSLAKAEPAKKIPWWKRLFSRKPAGAASGAAVTDPQTRAEKRIARKQARRKQQYRARMAMATLRQMMFLAAVVGVAIPFAVPSLRDQVFDKGGDFVAAARERLGGASFEAVNAVTVSASSAVPEHPANHAADLATNTFWAEGAEGDGIGQTISFGFQGAHDLARVIITPGATDVAGNFLLHPRPRKLHLTYNTGKSMDVTLKDEAKAQTFTLKDAQGVEKVDVAISEVYAGQGGQNTSIAEVEFKKKA